MTKLYQQTQSLLGNWDGAMLKSIMLVGVLTIFYYVIALAVSARPTGIYGLLVFIGLYAPIYFFCSFVGWFIMGLPVHWLICKYSRGGYPSYVLAILVFALMVYSVSNIAVTVFFAGVALLQVLIFKYYVFK